MQSLVNLQSQAINGVVLPKEYLQTMVYYSNCLAFGFAAIMVVVNKFLHEKDDRICTSNTYQTTNSLKESEMEFEFADTYNSQDIKEMMDLEFNAKNSKKQIKKTLDKVLKKSQALKD